MVALASGLWSADTGAAHGARKAQVQNALDDRMTALGPSAALAAREPPSCLSAFRLTRIAPYNSITAEFAVACKTCGQATFQISGFPKVAPDPSPYYQIAPGETLWRPPHSLKCTGCGTAATVFDARKNGYDGVLNGGCAYESGDQGEAFVPGVFKVKISATYNIDLDELTGLAREAKVRPPDLFDWLVIHGDAADGGKAFELGYECA